LGQPSILEGKFRFSEFVLRAETDAPKAFGASLRGSTRHLAKNKFGLRQMENRPRSTRQIPKCKSDLGIWVECRPR
jgi:hypothetical protein